MFDARLRPLIDPPLNRAGRWLAARGVNANQLTVAGILAGLGAAAAILFGQFAVAFGLVVAGRLLDGLDGAVARATRKTPFGGYLDIVGDFLFYVSVPLAFGLWDPANLRPAMVLLASFALTGVSFLALASIAAEQRLETSAHGTKSFFYSTGLAEGGETILAFLLMLLFPDRFPQIAWAFAALCGLTVVQRSLLAWRIFHTGP
jgi:phosphatidylglycerophosphate synthase